MTNAWLDPNPTARIRIVGTLPVTSFRHGVDVKAVQNRLGHSGAAVTLDVYSHLWPDSDDRTREAVERALAAPADTLRTAGS